MLPNSLKKILQQGIEFQGKGRLAEAAECYARLRAAAPAEFDAWHYGGMTALLVGRADEAAALLGRALELKPTSLQTTFGLGVANVARGELAAADSLLSAVTTKDPKLAEGWQYLALVFQIQGRLEEAIAARKRVVALKPKYAAGWVDLGSTLSLVGRQTEALECFTKALAIDSKNLNARLGRAMVLFKCHRVKEAVDEYAVILAKDPMQLQARSFRLMALNSQPEISREQLFAEHVAYGDAAGNAERTTWPNSPLAGRRIRVGFLSADFREHSVAYFIEPLLRYLDPTSFEIILYHDHPQVDAVSERLRSHGALWRHVAGRTDAMLVSAILADAPDLLVDLGGHTGVSRLRAFASRVAPVQITYLGYPNTTGVRAMDYRLVDATTDPAPLADAFATEKLIRFAPVAWAYLPPENAPEPGPLPASTNGYVTFGAFNNFTKVTDETLHVWGRLLAAVPGSRLLLKADGLAEPAVGDPIRARLRAAGVPEERVELLSRTPDTLSHLALYRRVDIALDTFPYHGTTTTCEALWMGVPVVTLAGDSHVSRVGVSLLQTVGLPGWIARDDKDYIRIAATAADNLVKLGELRTALRSDMRASALLDHAAQASRFGETLRTLWQNWCGAKNSSVTTVRPELAPL